MRSYRLVHRDQSDLRVPYPQSQVLPELLVPLVQLELLQQFLVLPALSVLKVVLVPQVLPEPTQP